MKRGNISDKRRPQCGDGFNPWKTCAERRLSGDRFLTCRVLAPVRGWKEPGSADPLSREGKKTLPVERMKRVGVLIVLVLMLGSVGCGKKSGYTLTSYRRGIYQKKSVITLRHASQTITAECESACDEFGTMVGQELSCFTEPAPSDRTHPYETKRPIFNANGGAFVCHPGKGMVFMIRHFECERLSKPLTDEEFENELQSAYKYPEDSLYFNLRDLDQLYCKPGALFRDRGGDIVTESGQVLPPEHHVEWLTIVEVK